MLSKKSVKEKLIALLLCVVFAFGCASPVPPRTDREVFSGFSVHYVDVGEGDCIFIRLPDNKNVLIDCANDSEELFEVISTLLDDYGVKTLDYFILTHPDSDHVGNAKAILENFTVGLVYHPHVVTKMLSYFSSYEKAYAVIEEKNISHKVSSCFEFVKGEGYQLVFLTPYPKSNINEGAYKDFNGAELPNETLTNNLSPIIYLEYAGVRFLFTGDAGKSQENLALLNVNDTLYKHHLNENNLSVNLNGIDFLKVSHHGSADSTSEEFLEVVKPKNAVISVGGNNPYGHPSTQLLQRLIDANSSYKLFRTDVHGTVSVGVSPFGDITVLTDLN